MVSLWLTVLVVLHLFNMWVGRIDPWVLLAHHQRQFSSDRPQIAPCPMAAPATPQDPTCISRFAPRPFW